jgi:hypothetical protein
MKKERKQRPRMEDLIPNSEIRKEVLKALYSGEGLTGRDGIFSQLLQDMVNAALEGEMDAQLPASPSLRIPYQSTTLVHGLTTCTYYPRVFKTQEYAKY